MLGRVERHTGDGRFRLRRDRCGIHLLACPATNRPNTAGGDDRHVAFVETGPEGASAGRRRDSYVMLERQVFLDRPAVIADGFAGRGIDHGYVKPGLGARRAEINRDCGSGTQLPQRILGLIGEGTGGCSGRCRSGEGAIGVQRHTGARRVAVQRGGCARRGGQHVPSWIVVVGQHTRSCDAELGRDIARVGVGICSRVRPQAAGSDVQRDRDRIGRTAVAVVGEGVRPDEIRRGHIDESAVGVEGERPVGRVVAGDNSRTDDGDVIGSDVAIDGRVVWHRIGIGNGGRRDGRGERAAGDLDKALHAAVALVGRGEAALAVEHPIAHGVVARRGGCSRTVVGRRNQSVVGLAGG